MFKPPICDDSRLSVLLRGDEHSDAYLLAADHVETCARCRERLTELAADAQTWEEARDQLRRLPDHSAHAGIDQPAAVAHSAKLDFLKTPAHPELLGRLGRYDIERAIGSGGMGIVLKAYDTELHRPVAIKVMAPHLAHSGAARQRFAREARAAAAVVHEHVIAIYDVVADNETPYLVMQFVPGHSLQTRLDECGTLSIMEILRIGTQAALGLEAAHAQGLVHRDVKPANILLQDGVERITLTDFGLARTVDDATMTHSGIIAGTPQYMSPEQARGETVDHRSDLFSLGSVLYAMCTGRPPFRAESTMGVLRRITDSQPHPIRDLNSDVPQWLTAIIAKLLSKNPAERFDSAAEVAALLEGCLKHVQTPDSAPLPMKVRQLVADEHHSQPLIESRVSVLAGALLLIAATIFAFAQPPENRLPQENSTNATSVNGALPVHSSNSAESSQNSAAISTDWEDGFSARVQDLRDRMNSLDVTTDDDWPITP